jgi:protoporphyrinogen oxidase
MSQNLKHVIVVGSGLAGLSASLEIEKLGGVVTLVEQSGEIGGRLKTDSFNGFLLDHGFQVLLSSYPEVKKLNILNSLNVKPFKSGAICHKESAAYTLINPLANFMEFCFNALKLSPFFYIDFLKLARMTLIDDIRDESTEELFDRSNLSDNFRSYFLKPFFGGVFLDIQLQAQSEIFFRYLKLFILGSATLPERGMHSLPRLMKSKLKKTHLILNQQVREFGEGYVCLADGKKIIGDSLVIAVENPAFEKLVGPATTKDYQSTYCIYFSVPAGLIKKSTYIHLGAQGPITNLSVLNHIQPSYAPKGFDLISATVIDPQWYLRKDIVKLVKENISSWFSISEKKLCFIKEYYIKYALPSQENPPILENKIQLDGYKRVYIAGEKVMAPSINGALASGKKAAQAAIYQADV